MSDKTVEFRGVKFTIPESPGKLKLRAVHAWEKEQPTLFVEAVMGPEAWNELLERVDPDMEEFWELAKVIGHGYGFEGEVGESSASEDSSETTSDLSRPTSDASTDSNSTVSASAP